MAYVQGFVIPVKPGMKEAYRELAAKVAPIFRDYGVQRIVECWGEDVPDGKLTDFRRAVQAEEGEGIVFSWMVWPDRATADAAHDKIMADPRMQEPPELPFEGKRMIFGGFAPIFDSDEAQGS
jgi:uncharacterized protein YbaA (DUF1428 family)